MLDHAAVAKAIGSASGDAERAPVAELPEPLASVMAYLGDDPDGDNGRTFVPTAELVKALDVEPTTFSRQMADLGCRPKRERIPTEDGTLRQVRGYLTVDIWAAAEAICGGEVVDAEVINGDD